MDQFSLFQDACTRDLAAARGIWAQHAADPRGLFPEGFCENAGDALLAACAAGQLETAQWLWGLRDPLGAGLTLANVQVEEALIFRSACVNGHLDVAQWLWDLRSVAGSRLTMAFVRRRHNEAFGYACGRGHLGVAQWLWGLRDEESEGDAGALTRADVAESRAFILACTGGRFEVVAWLWSLRRGAEQVVNIGDAQANNNAAFFGACRVGDANLMHYLLHLRSVTGEGLKPPLPQCHLAFIEACGRGHMEVAGWMEQYCAHNESGLSNTELGSTFATACRSGRLDAAKWIWERAGGDHGIRIDTRTLSETNIPGNVHTWLRQRKLARGHVRTQARVAGSVWATPGGPARGASPRRGSASPQRSGGASLMSRGAHGGTSALALGGAAHAAAHGAAHGTA